MTDEVKDVSSENISSKPWTAKRIPGLPKHWQNFFLSILFVLILPLLPILLELLISGQVKTDSLMLTASMYAIGIGITSNSKLMFGLTIIMGVIYAVAYGMAKSQTTPLPVDNMTAYVSIAIVFIIHTLERYNIHVVDRVTWSFPSD